MRIDELFMFICKGPEETIGIDKTILEKITGLGTVPLLWNRDGEYRLVPKEVVQNAISVVNSFSYLNSKTMRPGVCIYWNQGVPVNNQVGRILTGE